MGFEKPKAQVPVGVAYALCPLFEGIGKITKKTPLINRFRIKFLHTHLTFNINKARNELGYRPQIATREALRKSARWFASHRKEYEEVAAKV